MVAVPIFTMCGFVAILGEKNLDSALHNIKHRGQDSSRIVYSKNFSVGFNRLSINDKTDNGMQPFESGDLIGVFNGEIYNANLLKAEFNITTKSDSDTEIILPLFKKLGSSLIHYLDGFYSGIIYNNSTLQTFLLRDYIGKKPLFLAKNADGIFIVSELKALDSFDDFQIVPKGFSEFANGKIQTIEKHKCSILPKTMLKQKIVEAVKKRIPETERLFGVFVSGGLDSSIIAGIVSKLSDNVIYYTLGNSNDIEYMDILSKALGISDRIKKIKLPAKDEMPSLIEKIVYHTESYNPSIISNGLATYLLAAAAHEDGLKVVLSGEGSDELFCGYRVSPNAEESFGKRKELIENMHFTELRRLDLASMAHTVEIRCPFLDRQVFFASNDCTAEDLINNFKGKDILRKCFEKDLPQEIIQRDKVSFDVGSGIRKIVVEFLTKDGMPEKEALKAIWKKYFPESLSDNCYFHSYPTFDKAIESRGCSHKTSQLKKIEQLLQKEFETIPFHTLFLLNNKSELASEQGGTCSDKVLHFKKVLAENGIISKLHSAFINGIECHRMLTVDINDRKYFIDAGSGWPTVKLFPADRTMEYSVYGITFKTEFLNDKMLLFHKTAGSDFKLQEEIPLLLNRTQQQIACDIENRFTSGVPYPFQNRLRFSQVKNGKFYFIKDNKLKIYNDSGFEEKILSDNEVEDLIKNFFLFNPGDLKICHVI